MSSRVALTAALLLALPIAARADNAALLELIRGADLTEQVSILSGLKAARDPFAGDIIDALAEGTAGAHGPAAEHLLRVLLASLFGAGVSVQEREARLAANRQALEALFSRISAFSDPQLKSALVGLAPRVSGKNAAPLLCSQTAELAAQMRRRGGLATPMEGELAHVLLEAMAEIPAPDFLEPCLELARISRDRQIIASARDAARVFSALPR